MRTEIEITNYRDGFLEQGGVFGRLESWPTEHVAEALSWDADDIENFADNIVNGCTKVPSGITLASWLDMHYPGEGKVVRRGTIIR